MPLIIRNNRPIAIVSEEEREHFEKMLDDFPDRVPPRMRRKLKRADANPEQIGQAINFPIAPHVANSLENTQIGKFRTKAGHGFAAEDANALNDRFHGKKVEVTGGKNSLFGPDRVVDGVKVQTKYWDSARKSVNAAFDPHGGSYRYTGQVLEVPPEQYEEAVALMRERVVEGRVPGATDPAAAESLVQPGAVTRRQALNIARAGNIDSLVHDAKTGAINGGCAFGLSFLVHYASARWIGADNKAAAKTAVTDGLKTGSKTLALHVLTSQALKSTSSGAAIVLSRGAVKAAAQTQVGKTVVERVAQASLGKALYGAAATNHVAKLLRTNVVTGVIVTGATAAPDLYRAVFARSISPAQLMKNIVVNAAGAAGGVGGWMAGAAAGAALGSIVPGVGTAIGGFLGGLSGALGGGMAASGLAKAIGDEIAEDDAVAMLRIVQGEAERVATDFLLSEDEAERFAQRVQALVTGSWLREMYAAGRDEWDRRSFAHQALDGIGLAIASDREKIGAPADDLIAWALEDVANELSSEAADEEEMEHC